MAFVRCLSQPCKFVIDRRDPLRKLDFFNDFRGDFFFFCNNDSSFKQRRELAGVSITSFNSSSDTCIKLNFDIKGVSATWLFAEVSEIIHVRETREKLERGTDFCYLTYQLNYLKLGWIGLRLFLRYLNKPNINGLSLRKKENH